MTNEDVKGVLGCLKIVLWIILVFVIVVVLERMVIRTKPAKEGTVTTIQFYFWNPDKLPKRETVQ